METFRKIEAHLGRSVAKWHIVDSNGGADTDMMDVDLPNDEMALGGSLHPVTDEGADIYL